MTVMVVNLHLEGNLGDELETTPLLLELHRCQINIIGVLSRWQAETKSKAHNALYGTGSPLNHQSIREQMLLERLIVPTELEQENYELFLSNHDLHRDDIHAIIYAPGPGGGCGGVGSSGWPIDIYFGISLKTMIQMNRIKNQIMSQQQEQNTNQYDQCYSRSGNPILTFNSYRFGTNNSHCTPSKETKNTKFYTIPKNYNYSNSVYLNITKTTTTTTTTTATNDNSNSNRKKEKKNKKNDSNSVVDVVSTTTTTTSSSSSSSPSELQLPVVEFFMMGDLANVFEPSWPAVHYWKNFYEHKYPNLQSLIYPRFIQKGKGSRSNSNNGFGNIVKTVTKTNTKTTTSNTSSSSSSLPPKPKQQKLEMITLQNDLSSKVVHLDIVVEEGEQQQQPQQQLEQDHQDDDSRIMDQRIKFLFVSSSNLEDGEIFDYYKRQFQSMERRRRRKRRKSSSSSTADIKNSNNNNHNDKNDNCNGDDDDNDSNNTIENYVTNNLHGMQSNQFLIFDTIEQMIAMTLHSNVQTVYTNRYHPGVTSYRFHKETVLLPMHNHNNDNGEGASFSTDAKMIGLQMLLTAAAEEEDDDDSASAAAAVGTSGLGVAEEETKNNQVVTPTRVRKELIPTGFQKLRNTLRQLRGGSSSSSSSSSATTF